jgi:phosphomannomutase
MKIILKGECTQISNLAAYVDHLMTYIAPKNITSLKFLVNSGNGTPGHVVDAIEVAFNQLNIPIE